MTGLIVFRIFHFDPSELNSLCKVFILGQCMLPLDNKETPSIVLLSFASFSYISSLQCYSVLSDILVKNELCIPLERGSNILSTGEGIICLSPHRYAFLFYLQKDNFVQCYSVLSDFHPMANDDYVT